MKGPRKNIDNIQLRLLPRLATGIPATPQELLDVLGGVELFDRGGTISRLIGRLKSRHDFAFITVKDGRRIVTYQLDMNHSPRKPSKKRKLSRRSKTAAAPRGLAPTRASELN
jgi:hypothetical protein